MSMYSGFQDAPNQINKEGAEVTIKFIRNNDGTGVITWTIPPPSAGCAPGTQGAYDGIVITIDNRPADFIKTSPKNGIFYNGDATADRDVHLGDKLDTALVIGAFYNDRTTSLVITGIQPRTAYYVSGYAVDNVGTYFREGVHAYSLPTGVTELNNSTDDKEAIQDIAIDVLGGINVNRITGLNKTLTYDFVVNVNGDEYKLYINGSEAQTYKDLVNAINKQFKLLGCSLKSPPYPNAGGYYWDDVNRKLFFWDGTKNIEQPVIASNSDPSVPVLHTVWFNPDTKILYVYETSGWVAKPYIIFPTDPTKLKCGQLWYDGTNVWQWDGNHWCKLCLYVQTRNPILGPLFSCGTYWYDTKNKQFFSYNEKIKQWDEVLVILSIINPNALNTGDFWYNETDKFVYQFIGGMWNILNDIRYSERNEHGDLDFPVPDTYWFIPSELRLYIRNHANTVWIELPIALYPTDPRERHSCDLWWNESTTSSKLFTWDEVNDMWVEVQTFIQSINDPALPPELDDCAVWLNPETQKMKLIKGVTCDDSEYIYFPFDPTQAYLYEYWFDSTNNVWNVWNGNDWTHFDPIVSKSDPFNLIIGQFWFDLNNHKLYKWNGTGWDEIPFSRTPLAPTVGTYWFNTVDEQLYVWNGSSWVIADPIAGIRFINCEKLNHKCRCILEFYTRDRGCQSHIELKLSDDNLFKNLKDSMIYYEPVSGSSGLDAGPSYLQLGVGTDGSPDERREMHDIVRSTLGAPSVTVELTKEQIDDSINNALLMLRKYSSLSYRRGFFFLDVKRNQQTYIMTNKCVGFNKIVEIMGIYRMGTAFFRTAFGGNDAFGIAALQQLYSIGSFDMLSYHLVSAYVEELHTLFASRIRYQWNETDRELRLYQNFHHNERVLIDAEVERTEQDLLSHRETRLWIKNWVVAESKMKLSQPRGKFQQLPGPNGSTSLNTQDLISQAQDEMQRLRDELADMSMQGPNDVGLRTHLILG